MDRVDKVFDEYAGRRRGIIRALTTDVKEFFDLCDPEKDWLCLFGHPNGTWEVTVPPPQVPSELPDPIPGINFERNEKLRSHWLMMVAILSHSWLTSVAHHRGFHLNKNDRKRLFNQINDLPTVYEDLSEHLELDLVGGIESKVGIKRTSDGQAKNNSELPDQKTGEDKGDHDACGSCSGKKEFWIMCDTCQKWYHGKCVEVSPSQADVNRSI